MLVFDSNSLIALLRHEAGAVEVQTLLNSTPDRFIHAINLAEVFYDISRRAAVLTACATLENFAAGGLIERADLDPHFREDAAQLKAAWRRVSLADCCGLALARRLAAANVCRIRFFR